MRACMDRAGYFSECVLAEGHEGPHEDIVGERWTKTESGDWSWIYPGEDV